MQYTQKVIEHFKSPKNQGVIKNPSAVGEKGNPVCGDVMKIYLKIDKRKSKSGQTEQYIKDVKFETLGCVAAVATSSILTEIVKGMSLEKAFKISKNDIVKKLGGLPKQKIHCSMLGIEALREAINEFKK